MTITLEFSNEPLTAEEVELLVQRYFEAYPELRDWHKGRITNA